MLKLSFPNFEDIQVSTKTFIVTTNVHLQIYELFKVLPITDYVLIPKKRGRRKKVAVEDPNKDIAPGSIITLEYETQLRGVNLKNKVKKKYFRNSVTVVIMLRDKMINFKMSGNGKLQMTGCKTDQHAEEVVKFFWGYIKQYPQFYSFYEGEKDFKAMIIPTMRNIDFNLGFKVDREELDSYINEETIHNSTLDTTLGYTGVNIKLHMSKDIGTLPIKTLTEDNGEWKEGQVTLNDYLDTLPKREREKKIKNNKLTTFLVFQSGKCILSSMHAEFQRDVYNEFLQIIRDSYEYIEERLVTDDRPIVRRQRRYETDNDIYDTLDDDLADTYQKLAGIDLAKELAQEC